MVGKKGIGIAYSPTGRTHVNEHMQMAKQFLPVHADTNECTCLYFCAQNHCQQPLSTNLMRASETS